MKSFPINEGWEVKAAGRPAWPAVPATVPGHVHLDLMKAGIIQDPFYRMQEIGAAWVDEESWVYTNTFKKPESQPGEQILLCFEGLDSVGTIFLNGESFACFDSMHLPLTLDVTEKLQEENTLEITFESPQKIGRKRREAYFAAEGLPDDTACFDPRAFVRKAQYMYGWDWGPVLASCGIWQPVCLKVGKARFEWVWPRQQHRPDGSVMLSLTAGVQGEAHIRYRLTSPSGDAWQAEDPEAQILINKPELWWPNCHGDQPLYTLEADLVADGEVLDTWSGRIGLRTIELRQTPDADGAGFEFVVNGSPIYAAGSNWIPDHSFPSIISRERVFSQIQLAKEMNSTMIRVWGGGLMESDDFYDACDEMGILVWQDFPFGCAYSPENQEYRDVVKLEAAHHIKRLRWRASLAHWCGNNENETMFDGPWGGDKAPKKFYGEVIWNEDLPQVLAELDPDGSYTTSSPTGAKGHSNGDDRGDVHYWGVWHGEGDWHNYRKSRSRFVSEFGFSASPSHEVWETCLGPDDYDARSEVVKWHDKTLKGYDRYFSYIETHYPPIQTLNDLVYSSQMNQRDAMRFALHHFRTVAPCRGALIWQLNDCWPVQSWALVDFNQIVKPAGEEMKRCFAPLMVAVQVTEGKVELWIVNDSQTPAMGDVKATVFSTETGDARGAWSYPAQSLFPGEKKLVHTWDRSSFGDESLVMEATWGEVEPCVTLLQAPKDTVAGQPKLKAVRRKEGVEVTVTGAPAVDVLLIRSALSPRSFTVLPGRTTLLTGEGDVLEGLSLNGDISVPVK